MAAEGRPFTGIIFFGLMLTADGPKVLEYNARFGDPEAQVVLPRMKTDIIEVMEACVNGTLDQVDLEFEDNAAVCVVLASDGYPVKYEKGIPMHGLPTAAVSLESLQLERISRKPVRMLTRQQTGSSLQINICATT